MTCREPGPYAAHCTEGRDHRWSHYDAGEDTSWNDRAPEGWQQEAPHLCEDVACMGALYEEMLGVSRPLEERKADFDRITQVAPTIKRGRNDAG